MLASSTSFPRTCLSSEVFARVDTDSLARGRSCPPYLEGDDDEDGWITSSFPKQIFRRETDRISKKKSWIFWWRTGMHWNDIAAGEQKRERERREKV